MAEWSAVLKIVSGKWLRGELFILSVVCLSSGALLAFALLASEVMEGETLVFDQAVLLALRVPGHPAEPIGPLWLEAIFRDITSLGSVTVITLITTIAGAYLLLRRKFLAATLVLISIGSGAVVSTAFKDYFARPRPDLIGRLVDVQSLSFPSGHATLSAVTYLTLAALLANEQPGYGDRIYLLGSAIALTLLIGCSRVFLGVHWPTDVLAGWSFGAAWAMLWLIVFRILSRSRAGTNGP